jgi:hypothetical protein
VPRTLRQSLGKSWARGCWPVSRLASVLAAARGGSGGAGFEPDGAEVVAGGEAHVGVECGG